jgi:hypothetical protein
VFPKLEAVKQKRGRDGCDQDNERGISAGVQRQCEPCAPDQDPEKPDRRKDVGSSHAKPANEARADEWKKVSGDGVCVIVVNLEERFHVRETFPSDDWQRNIERVIGPRNRVLRRDEFDPWIADEEGVGPEICGQQSRDSREQDEKSGRRENLVIG